VTLARQDAGMAGRQPLELPPEDARVAMCVITVTDGPDGLRAASVAFRPDLARGAADERRTRVTSVAEVLDQVAVFLAAAGIP
jgi:hypothetical protein